MKEIFTTKYNSPIGELFLGELDESLCLCDWSYRKKRKTIDQRIKTYFSTEYIPHKTDFLQSCIHQLDEYFAGQRKVFDLKLNLAGTDFQKRIWNVLCDIPYGTTISYIQLSKIFGDEKALRAVASANGANAISIIVPCHRVIGSNGQLTGYAGGLSAKKFLLNLEGSFDRSQLKLF